MSVPNKLIGLCRKYYSCLLYNQIQKQGIFAISLIAEMGLDGKFPLRRPIRSINGNHGPSTSKISLAPLGSESVKS